MAILLRSSPADEAEPIASDSQTDRIARRDLQARAATPLPDGYGQPFRLKGTAHPIKFDVFDPRTKRMERGLGYPVLSPGKLTFAKDEDRDRWSDPTRPLQAEKGGRIATIVDADLDARLAAERGRLAPLWAEYKSMVQLQQRNPEAMSPLLLALKEGEAIQLETAILEKEMEAALRQAVVAPADCEIIEGTRHSVNLSPQSGDLFRYYPLSHVRLLVRVPLAAWAPDGTTRLTVDGQPAQILRVYSVDLDETNEQWILGMEVRPARSLEGMSQEFDFELTATPPAIERLSQGVPLHDPSGALVGRRRTYPATAPKIPGLLFFSAPENSWVRKGELIGGVTLAGMDALLQKVNRYCSWCDEFIHEAETKFVPSGAMAENDRHLILLRQYRAEAGRFVERASAMTIEAKETGLLVGTLDYQGPLTADSANLPARVKSPYVEILDVRLRKEVDVRDGDIVFVELPSGTEELAEVFKVVPETVGSVGDLSATKLISVLVYDDRFRLGEAPGRGAPGGANATVESGMPVYVSVPRYGSEAERTRIQSRLRHDFETRKEQPPPDRPLFPIRFTFTNSSLCPLEKMAYMRRAGPGGAGDGTGPSSYLDALTEAIIREHDPELRWVAFRKLTGSRYTAGFGPLVQIALRGKADVASASLFELKENRREFELLDVLRRLQAESRGWDEPTRNVKGPLLSLCYQLLRGLIDYPDARSDALSHLVERGRLDSAFQRRLVEFFFAVIRTEGVNAPAALRILRGRDHSGQPFLPDRALISLSDRAKESGDRHLSRVFRRELDRRELVGISRNTRYGYGATFIEKGFLYLRDLEKIDVLARCRENCLQDLRFLESSPHWNDVLPLDPEVLRALHLQTTPGPPAVSGDGSDSFATGLPNFGQDIQFAAFHQLTKPERSLLIENLGTKRDYSTLVLLLRDPFIRHQHAGDILDGLLGSPAARLELARYYARCPDQDLLELIDERQFAVEVLPDIHAIIRQLEQPLAEADDAGRRTTQPVSPASIHIYQQLLLRLWQRAPNEESRFHDLVAWAGLLPSGFELEDDSAILYAPLQDWGVPQDRFRSAVGYVRERRALKHAVDRQREKRAENKNVEIHPGPEETRLRRICQEVEAGMPPRQHPLALLEQAVAEARAAAVAGDALLSLEDAVRLAGIRDREFATGTRARLRFQDIAAYAARIVLAPLYLLAVVPLIWLANLVLLLVETLGLRRSGWPNHLKSSLQTAERMWESIEEPGLVKREIARWIKILKNDELNVDRLVRLQERVKRILNCQELVYHVSVNGKGGTGKMAAEAHGAGQSPLDPDVSVKLAPCLTLLATLCRLTAERIGSDAYRDADGGPRTYFLMEWFLQRSIYFSGYRYALNPLANYQIAENYIWQDIPLIAIRGQWVGFWLLLVPLNVLIGAVNLFGHIFFSLPMRFLYLFTPISLLGAGVFKWSLRRLVIDRGNLLENHLYPDPDDLMRRTRQRLRTGWAHRAAQPDQPGGRFLFSFRRIATRILPFVVVTTIVSGGFPYVYEMLTGQGWMSAWNLRSTGIFAAFAALVVLTLTMVLHWLPLLMGWIPFAHLRNLNRIRLLRRRARKAFLAHSDRKPRPWVNADDQLQTLYFEDALKHLRAERDSDAPVLHLLVLMVEDPTRISRYRTLARSLVSAKTAVLAYATSESMDGGGARLATLKTVHETYASIRARHPQLPDRFDETRSCFMPIGDDCDPLIALPVQVADPTGPPDAGSVPLTPFVLALANVQSLMRHSFLYQEQGETNRFYGSITVAPQRLYVGPHNVDQGGRFRGGITLVGAFESIHTAGQQGALVVMGNRAFIRSSPEQLRAIIHRHFDLQRWLDPDNVQKRQLPVAQLVIERFRTPERYGRHIGTCIRYIDEIQKIRTELLDKGPQGARDVSDEALLNDIAIHYMRHLIVPWFMAYQGGSLESYRSAVLTGELGVLDRRRAFHQRVLELVELFQEEGQTGRRQLPKVRFVSAPSARIFYAKTSEDAAPLWTHPHRLFPEALAKPAPSARQPQRSPPLPAASVTRSVTAGEPDR